MSFPYICVSHIFFNFSSFYPLIQQQHQQPLVLNTRPFSSFTPLERHKKRQRQRQQQQQRQQLKQQQEHKAKNDEEVSRQKKGSMSNFKVPSVDQLFPCLLQRKQCPCFSSYSLLFLSRIIQRTTSILCRTTTRLRPNVVSFKTPFF